jgi:acetyltransferase-like isoleucine patch superfamily enzyme
MSEVITRLAPYEDDRGNAIEYTGDPVEQGVAIKFTGSNNRVRVASPVRIGRLQVDFDCDNGLLTIGASSGVPAFSTTMRIGQDSSVRIGANVSTTSAVSISATEGTTVTIGNDVMFASGNEVRADDGHPIFDVTTGKRVNVSKSITIGDHVWLGRLSAVLGGARIGNGTVIGYGSIVTGRIPNNCVAVGTPARPVRYDTAWERPHLSLVRPYYKPDASTVTRTPYWHLSERPPEPRPKVVVLLGRAGTRATGVLRRITRRLAR